MKQILSIIAILANIILLALGYHKLAITIFGLAFLSTIFYGIYSTIKEIFK